MYVKHASCYITQSVRQWNSRQSPWHLFLIHLPWASGGDLALKVKQEWCMAAVMANLSGLRDNVTDQYRQWLHCCQWRVCITHSASFMSSRHGWFEQHVCIHSWKMQSTCSNKYCSMGSGKTLHMVKWDFQISFHCFHSLSLSTDMYDYLKSANQKVFLHIEF